MLGTLPYRHIVAVDFEFEFGGHDGNRPRPVCMVANELRPVKVGAFGAASWSIATVSIGETLFVAFYASAELGCFGARLADAGAGSGFIC